MPDVLKETATVGQIKFKSHKKKMITQITTKKRKITIIETPIRDKFKFKFWKHPNALVELASIELKGVVLLVVRINSIMRNRGSVSV